jgi:hypothetical protein
MSRVCESRFLDRTFKEAVQCSDKRLVELVDALVASVHRVFTTPGTATMGDFLSTAGVILVGLMVSLWIWNIWERWRRLSEVHSDASRGRTPLSTPPDSPLSVVLFFLVLPFLVGVVLVDHGWERDSWAAALTGVAVILGVVAVFLLAWSRSRGAAIPARRRTSRGRPN